MCFLWQHDFFWYLPGTACLYSGPSPGDLACLRNHLHACRYWHCGCHPQDTAVGRDRTHYSFSIIRAVVYGFSSNMRSKQVRWFTTYYSCVYLIFLCYSYDTRYFHAYSYHTYILVVRCMKQNKDAVCTTFSCWGACWSKLIVLIYDIICMYVRVVTFDFSLK